MSYELYLAPMEGVVDFILRDVLTGIGGIDQCVTEFIRVTDQLHSPAVIYRYAPELKMGSRTRAGTAMFLQYLGGQPGPMAENAARGAELGALGIDLNFGCPAKTVNRHDGGASLLKCPDRVFQIISAVRRAVPAHIPVTAKMRLGFDDPGACFENAMAVEAAGASWLTIHCRTKTDGYKPPAYWEWIPRIKEKVRLPIVANGEIWNVEDFWK
jgi:tRNA-dihydrouridine synthase C